MRRALLVLGAALTALLAAFGISQLQMGAAQADSNDAPRFSVDPSWPKALPHNWQIGAVPGIAVDKDDNIWIVQRPRTLTSDEAGATGATRTRVDANGVPFPCDMFGFARPQGSISDCCLPAPSIMQFDPKSNLLRAWGGP